MVSIYREIIEKGNNSGKLVFPKIVTSLIVFESNEDNLDMKLQNPLVISLATIEKRILYL